MKRWLAGLLAAAVLLSGIPCLAENVPGMTNADIQETVVTREEEAPGSLEQNFRLIMELLENEDVRSLLQIQDVKDISSELIWKTLVWLYQNRSVTMKILAELGMSEADIRCVGKLWDSAERISEATAAYEATEDGKRLREEFTAVRNDPEILAAMNDLLTMVNSESIISALDRLEQSMNEISAEQQGDPQAVAGSLVQAARDNNLNRQSFKGQLIMELLTAVEQSGVAESLPKLKNNRNLWTLLLHLSEESDLDRVYKAEFRTLSADPEMTEFIRRLIRSLSALVQKYQEKTSAGSSPAEKEMIP